MTAKEFWNTQVPTDANKCYIHDYYARKFSYEDLFRFAEAYASLKVAEATKQRDELLEALKSVFAILSDGQELNMSNYNHDQVGSLNDAYVNAYLEVEAMITKTEEK